jgi:DNA-binding NtrC family response regulator
MFSKRRPHILLVDDDGATRYLLGLFCKTRNFKASAAKNGKEALSIFRNNTVDLVVTDLQMPDMDGEHVLREIKNESPDTGVLIMTQWASVEEAVRLLRLGADDYITKPITEDVFLHRTELALERSSLNRELDDLKQTIAASSTNRLIGQSPAISSLKSDIGVAAQSEASVVILGESGTGKELVASNIHTLSRRNDEPFVIVNCGSIPDTLLESELFGYKRGAFTDAHRDTPGLVEAAEGGTLFLDEVGEISLAVQVKLLRFLQSKEYKPLGLAKPRTANVRIVAATNRNLQDRVAGGFFREDLYYRLNVIPLHVPPLRERKNDIPLLAAFFLDRYKNEHGKEKMSLSLNAFEQLKRHPWPGNVRELENKIQQLVVLTSASTIDYISFGANKGSANDVEYIGSFKEEKKEIIAQFERHFVRQLLDRANGNLSQAAKMAQLDRKNFWVLAKRHALWPISGRAEHEQNG